MRTQSRPRATKAAAEEGVSHGQQQQATATGDKTKADEAVNAAQAKAGRGRAGRSQGA